ncbi:MAG: phytanoyl-CoA dioxygenase family protein [Planctomycetes bacterium]|nr:phytanoyl-CoA dioxygenase family protein [Planctomycetota bacterium]
MAFRFEDWMINHYLQQGYVVFRGVVPPSLCDDLRREIDKARDMAHAINPQAQRLQPVAKYEGQIDQKPFQDYCDLPALRDAIDRLLGPDFTTGQRSMMGIFVEPRDQPWTIGWHRDGVVEVPLEAQDEELRLAMDEFWHDLRGWNQVNCAIYADSCTWYVPGSHLRSRDLPGEKQYNTDKEINTRIAAMSPAEAERKCLDLCHRFPGAVQMHLGPGDYMLYRQLAWHNGNYTPWARRGTIHDGAFYTKPLPPAIAKWQETKKAAVARMNARQAVPVTV